MQHAAIAAAERAAPANVREIAARIRATQEADPRGAISVRAASVLTGKSERRIYELIASGELPSFLDGRSRRLATADLYDFWVMSVLASFDETGAPKKSKSLLGNC